MNIILTSDPGIGKTTVCEKLIGLFKENNVVFGGILCKDDMIEDLGTGEKKKFLFKEEQPESERIGPYFIKKDVLKFGEQAILNSEGVTFIDEFGPLELTKKKGFYEVTKKVLPKKNNIILIRKIILKGFMREFPDEYKIFEISEENRDELPEKILNYLNST
jgi:nucleoside-triphosphatase